MYKAEVFRVKRTEREREIDR
jgi:hypothetical protein